MNEEKKSRVVFDPFELLNDDGDPTNPQIAESFTAVDLINDYLSKGYKVFRTLLEHGISIEKARLIMPLCTKESIIMTDSELARTVEQGSSAITEYNFRIREKLEKEKISKPKIKKYKKFNKYELQEIEKAHLLGSTVGEIASLYGVSEKRIRTALKKANDIFKSKTKDD